MNLRQTREAVVALLREVEATDIRRFEDVAAAEVMELSRRVAALLARAIEVIGTLASLDTSATAHEGSFELAVDGLLARPEGAESLRVIGDLAFIANIELRRRLDRVRGHSAERDPWELVCDCGSAVRRVQKSLAALEVAFCRHLSEPQTIDFESELKIALEVRRLYRKLWVFTHEVGEVDERNVCHALRGAGTHCAILIGRSVYCQLRERDRFSLRQLQKRILQALLQQHDARACVRVWEDFAGFVEMLRQINNRQELVEHDRDALVAAEALLQRGEVSAAIGHLSDVVGLDDALDHARATGDAEGLAAAALRLAARYRPTATPTTFSSSPSGVF